MDDQLVLAGYIHVFGGYITQAGGIQLLRDGVVCRLPLPDHLGKLFELHASQQGAELRHPTAVAKIVMKSSIAHSPLSLVPMRARKEILFIAVRCDHASFTRRHHLGGKEGKCRTVGQLPAFDPAELAPVGVSRILHHEQPSFVAIFHDGRELR